MSFGGGFGSGSGGGTFGGFGQNNQNNATTGSSLFGGNTATSGGFGGGGGFGANNATNNTFGAKTGFGAPATTTGSSLFGGTTTNTGGFGGGAGFGTNNASSGAALSTGFGGASNTSSNLFGAKPATGFGAANTGSSLFGGGGTATGFGANNTASTFGGASGSGTGFGASNTNNSFGANNTSTFGGGFGGAAATTNTGTASTPFTAFTEKDTAAGNTTSAYQSITMQQPYQNKSFDELRLEDYAANKRFPQNNSFGASTTFGSTFGANNTNTNAARPGLFGATNNTSTFGAGNAASATGFGANNTTFGANAPATGGGLFGAKTGGSLFGGNNTTTTGAGFGSTPAAGGGLFGNNAATGTSTFGNTFGANAANNTQQSGGLFGNNNAASKPGFGFGAGAATNNTTTTNPFGGGGAFGNNAASTTQPSGGLFGGAANNNAFGNNNTSGGLFGNAAAKPAGGSLFGGNTTATNTTGGLFGNANNTSNAFGNNASGGLFGAGNTNNAQAGSGGLFGANAAAKPSLFGGAQANTGGSLFGGQNQNNTTATTGGGLFGSNNTGGGLFGNNNNAAKPGNSMFGNSGTTGGGLFSNTNNNNTGGGLFGGNNQNTAGGGLFGSQQGGSSLFGNAGAQQQSQLTASITGDPYGNAQLFASLASPSPPVGPLATPLSGARPVPKARASLLASVRGGSPMVGAGTSVTPRGRPGYGFSYSNYNSPLSSTPVLTPGATSLLRPTGSLGSSLSSRLSKSFSTSNLRSEVGEGQSLLRTPAPGQGSLLLGSGSLGSGSVRRLKIDRSLRTDLFGDTPKKIEATKETEKEPELRKRVSFDRSAEKEAETPVAKPSASNALVVRDDDESATPKAPEMSQINSGQSLTTVQEEAASDKTASPHRTPDAGEYFTEPPLKQLKSMSRSQLSQLKSFAVGRKNIGKIEFGRGSTVDISSVPLDDICGKIVLLRPRSATVYQDDSSKPPVGKGLNLPSTIHLEQSFPRSARRDSSAPQQLAEKDVERHKNRLRRVGGTKFVDYNDESGIWSFTVEHFTTYELDDEDETTMHDTTQEVQNRSFDSEQSIESPDLGDQDDTFQFKLAQRSQQSNLSLPGGFEDSMALATYDHDASADEMQEDDFAEAGGLGQAALDDPFLEQADAVQPPSPGNLERYHNELADEQMHEEKEVPGSFHADPDALKSILKPSAVDQDFFENDNLAGLSWEDQLQRTLSPKKRDRQALRGAQSLNVTQTDSDLLRKSLLTRSQLGGTQKGKDINGTAKQSEAFETSMDIMRSLWADGTTAKTKLAVQSLTSTNLNNATHHNRALKPTFSKNDTLLFAGTSATTRRSSDMNVPLRPAGQRDIKLYHNEDDVDDNTNVLLKLQQSNGNTIIENDDMELDDEDEEEFAPGMPSAMTYNRVPFKSLADTVTVKSESSQHEKQIWELCSALFDGLEICAVERISGMEESVVDDLQAQIRNDTVVDLWTHFITKQTEVSLHKAATAEEKAILYLCLGDVYAASEVLIEAKNTRLAVMVSQLPGSESNRELIRQQIAAWLERKDWSEFSDGQRALYSILSGSTTTVIGTKKAAAEDKVAEFCLSQRFGLSWQQSLALTMRYAGKENFQQAITAYINAVDTGVEATRPVPWHKKSVGAEDALLAILRLLTQEGAAPFTLDAMVVSGSTSQNRLVWQLATLLSARGVVQPSDDQMDALTMNLADELERSDKYLLALWVQLHLNENSSRYTAIKAVLDENSAKIPDPSAIDNDFKHITETLLIPATLVWSAKASDAKGNLHSSKLQCHYLLRAGTQESYKEAHQVLCSKVGPQAVIEQYYDDLSEVIQQFYNIGGKHFDEWETGGQLYLHLCQLMHLAASKSHSKEAEVLLKKLDQGLEAQREAGEQGLSLEMRVARIEMRKLVSERVKQFEDSEKWYSGATAGLSRHNKGVAMLERYMQALGQVH